MASDDLNVKRYVGLQHDLLSYIAEHHLTAGDKLPVESEIAKLFSVSITTVRRALHELAEAGLIDRCQGKGTFLRKNITESDPGLGTLLFATLDKGLPPSFSFVEDFRRRCWEHGWKLRTVYAQDSDMSGFINAARGAGGIFIWGRCGEYAVPVINSLKVPTVVIGETSSPLNSTYVSFDFVAEITLLMKEFAAQGVRRIAFLNAPEDYIPAQIFGKTFTEQCRALGLASGEEDILWFQNGIYKEDIMKFFRKKPLKEYDAILCEGGLFGFFTSYILLSGQAAALPRLGILSVNPQRYYYYEGVLHVVYKEDLVEKCVDTMMRRLSGGAMSSPVLLQPELVIPEPGSV